MDKFQRNALKQALAHLHVSDQVFLFGSRVDDDKHGGDVDVLIYSKQPAFELSRKISRDFFKHCEEKIDVVVIDPSQATVGQQVFINAIEKVAIEGG